MDSLILNWKYKIIEESMGVYKIFAINDYGNTIELQGNDCDKLMEDCKSAAIKMDIEIKNKNE